MGIECEFVPFLDYLGQYVAVLDMHAWEVALSDDQDVTRGPNNDHDISSGTDTIASEWGKLPNESETIEEKKDAWSFAPQVAHICPRPTELKGQAPGYPQRQCWNYEVPQTTLYKTQAKPK